MRLILEVRSGPWSGKKIVVDSDQAVRVGRTVLADVSFPDDSHMSGVHFRIDCGRDKASCFLEDLHSSNGTFLNSVRTGRSMVAHGDMIVAGETTFFVRAEADSGRPVSPGVPETAGSDETQQEHPLTMLRDQCQPLYAVLDAAAEPSVLKALFEAKAEYQSLYEGAHGAQLAHFAPYLVRLPQDSALLPTLVEQGWGKNWGVYLTCDKPLQEVRRHLRRFLMVRMPDAKKVYFRFYDPRVLRVFLPTCTPEETTQFFGPIQNYLVEDEISDHLLRFVNTGQGSQKMLIALQEGEKPNAPPPPKDDR